MSDSALRALVGRAEERALTLQGAAPARLVVVDVDRQRLYLVNGGRIVADYPVSTAAAGIGGGEGSLRTPPGLHRIERKIGDEATPGTIFESREATGAVWRGQPSDEDLILTRILTLDGQEVGQNRGTGCDSLARFIYIHGTNHEDALGTPASHGCVRMANRDVVELFDQVDAGDPVVIV
jgi:lipoprotein-anchoring transpeptidase ErfK/SrfK